MTLVPFTEFDEEEIGTEWYVYAPAGSTRSLKSIRLPPSQIIPRLISALARRSCITSALPSISPASSDSLNHQRPLTCQHLCIPIMTLLLAVFQSTTLVILQHPMLAAEMSLAEGTVAHDTLCALLAVFEIAFYLLWGHTAADGEGHVEGGSLLEE